jgi:hypothetical protein
MGGVALLVPLAWLAVHLYREDRPTANSLCELARPGMQVQSVMAKATQLQTKAACVLGNDLAMYMPSPT